MPYTLQSKLLRVLQERQVMRIGSQKFTPVNIRLIAATNQDLEGHVHDGRFREDLYYRLNVLPLSILPLRQRPMDILFLFNRFLSANGGKPRAMAPPVEDALLRYTWPGNVRELGNVASYAAIFAEDAIDMDALSDYILNRIGDFDTRVARLDAHGYGSTIVDVIRTLVELTSPGTGNGVGRATICAALAGRGTEMGEGRVRGILDLLNQEGLVESSPGRNGTTLTETGRLFYNWLAGKNQI
jgi:DNA-binding NtrC family response regulator